MNATPLRVAICDDSRAFTVGLRRFLETDRRLQVVAVAFSAEQLLRDLVSVRPDLVTMDLELPGMNGIEAIRRIMEILPVPIAVISARTAGGADGLVGAALAAGAHDAVAKDELRLDRRLAPRAVVLRRRLLRLARTAPAVAAAAPSSARLRAETARMGPLPRAGVATVVGIGASAGGPGALNDVLGALPADYDLPVLVVQHISDGFASVFATWLDGVVDPAVRLAGDGEPAGRGVAIAPDGAHLLLAPDRRLQLDARGAPGAHRPSADALLTSLADVAGPGAVAVVLSGLGRDGAAGVRAVRAAGGVALTERAEHAGFRSMPDAATEAGATPLERDEIGRALASLARSAQR